MNPAERTRRFWTNFRSLAFANIASQALTALCVPLLAWFYDPVSFGYLAYFMMVFQIFVSFCTLRFDWIVPNAVTRREELNLLALGGFSLLAISTLSALFVLVPPPQIRSWDGYETLRRFWYLLPLALLGTGLRNLVSAGFVRREELRPVSFVRVFETLTNIVAALVLGVFSLTLSGLILAKVLSCWTGILYLAARTDHTVADRRQVTRRVLGFFWKKHIGNALRISFVSFINTVSSNLALILLGIFFGLYELGLYAMVSRLVSTPLRAAGSALSKSFWAQAAGLVKEGEHEQIARNYSRITRFLLMVSLGIIALIFVASLFMERILPEAWKDLPILLCAYTPIIPGLVAISTTNHLLVYDKTQLQLIADFTRIALVLILVPAMAMLETPFWMVVLGVAISSALGHLVLYLTHRYVHKAQRTA